MIDVLNTIRKSGELSGVFRANKNGSNQSIPATTFTKLTFTNEVFDPDGYYDAPNSKYIPKKPGYYRIRGGMLLASATGVYLYIYKNGVADTAVHITSGDYAEVENVVYLDGVDDYVEIYTYLAGAQTVDGLITYTNFSATRVVGFTDSIPARSIIDLTNATVDYQLSVGETARINYNADTSVPLHIATVEGLYELVVIGNQGGAISNYDSAYLEPNNTTVAAGVIDKVGFFQALNTGQNNQHLAAECNGTTNQKFRISDGLVCFCNYRISTHTVSKFMVGETLRRDSSTNFYRFSSIENWMDTTTAWTSLGTITFAFAQTGIIYVKRVL